MNIPSLPCCKITKSINYRRQAPNDSYPPRECSNVNPSTKYISSLHKDFEQMAGEWKSTSSCSSSWLKMLNMLIGRNYSLYFLF